MTPPPPSHGRRRQGSSSRSRSSADSAIGNRRRRKRRTRARKRQSRRFVLLALFVVVPLLLLVGATIGGTAAFGSSCDLNSLQPVAVGENSFVYASDGSVLGAIPAERNRTPVTRREISPWVPAATLAIEDRRFYHHGGVDPVGIMRAVVADVRAGKIVQGGSTITQELVRNLYLSREQKIGRAHV